LWAGIVKALAEEIENVCGVFTTRIFRSICLECISEPESDTYRNQRRLFLEFSDEVPSKKDKAKFEEIMKNCGGPLKNCLPYSDWKEKNKDIKTIVRKKKKCWVVEYKKVKYAHKAYEALKSFGGVKVSYSLPSYEKTMTNNDGGKDRNLDKNEEENVKPHFPLRIGNILITVGFICIIVCSIVFSIYAFQNDLFEINVSRVQI